jgi:hypothetical protein
VCFSQVNKKKAKEANVLLHYLSSFKLGLTILASKKFLPSPAENKHGVKSL